MSGALILATTVTTMSSRKDQRQGGRLQDPGSAPQTYTLQEGPREGEEETHLFMGKHVFVPSN